MSHKSEVCRFCTRARIQASGRRPFVIPGAEPHYAPDRPIRMEHIRLTVDVDPKNRTVKGVALERFRVVSSGEVRLTLDQIGLEFSAVKFGATSLGYTTGEGYLSIELPAKITGLLAGETFELEIHYRVSDMRRGLYFTGPDSHYPEKPWQVWSQGQDEDNRHWIPLQDYPNQKLTSEVIATVPKGYLAVSNGALVSQSDEEGKTKFHYSLATPHVCYLITLVVGDFAFWEDEGPRGLPVQYFVEKGREADGKRAFSATSKMIEAFESKIGVSYPYEKYSQVAVQDFIFGGMENTSATTQTDRTLHDERAHLDFSSDPLVSHELAHQWFGDLLTCKDWSHGWLNEGFATFMERVWIENDVARFGSRAVAQDEAKYYQYQDLREHLDEDAGAYRRPIVCRTYNEPIDLFDTHLYQKGGLVLNLIRAELGEDPFWRSIRLYVERHRGGSVETLDLIRAIEDSTGRNLRRFFDEWIFSAGYPDLEVSYSWHEDKKLVELVIEQKQTDGQKEKIIDGFVTPLFHLNVPVELVLQDGKLVRHTVEVGALRERIFLPAASKPKRVRLDPGGNIPKALKFSRPKELLQDALENDPDCMGRIEAAHELARAGDVTSIALLAQALRDDAFWGVQAECAAALASLRLEGARDALVAALNAKHPKTRRAVVQALGRFGGFSAEAVAFAVKPLAQKDASYLVEAEATTVFAHARSRHPEKAADTEAFLLAQTAKEGWLGQVRSAALLGLAELPGIDRGDRPAAVRLLIEWTARGKPGDARWAAMNALGRVARTAVPTLRREIFELLDRLADEDGFMLRMKLVGALAATDDVAAAPILEKIARIDSDGRTKRSATIQRYRLLESGNVPESVERLRGVVEKLEDDYRKVKARLEEAVLKTRAGTKPARSLKRAKRKK